jgi:hypothetical protein
MKRPPEKASSVIAVIAVIAGVRAGICIIVVPTLIFVVPRQDPGSRRHCVGTVGFRGPHRVEAQAFSLGNSVERKTQISTG